MVPPRGCCASLLSFRAPHLVRNAEPDQAQQYLAVIFWIFETGVSQRGSSFAIAYLREAHERSMPVSCSWLRATLSHDTAACCLCLGSSLLLHHVAEVWESLALLCHSVVVLGKELLFTTLVVVGNILRGQRYDRSWSTQHSDNATAGLKDKSEIGRIRAMLPSRMYVSARWSTYAVIFTCL